MEHYLVRFGSRFPSFLLKIHDFFSGTVFGPEQIFIPNQKKNGRVRYGTVRYGRCEKYGKHNVCRYNINYKYISFTKDMGHSMGEK